MGDANLDFWKMHLKGKSIQPYSVNGSAEITISATELSWIGFRFNELVIVLSIAEAVRPEVHSGYFLMHAYNSNKLLTFCERTFFSTPYYNGNTVFRTNAPCSIEAHSHGQLMFAAKMTAPRKSLQRIDDDWSGPVYLPNGQDLFYVRLDGPSELYPFKSSADSVTICTNTRHRGFNLLRDSNFVGREWRCRIEAFHARTKTYKQERSFARQS